MKQVGILGGLLALALVGTYVSWTAPDEEPAVGDVLVLRASDADLTSITWNDDERTVRLSRPEDAHGAYFWLEATERTTPDDAEKKDAGEDDAEADQDQLAALDGPVDADATKAEEAGEAPVVEETTRFLGSDQAEEVWSAFTPLYALRELETGPDVDLAAFGLDEVSTTIRVELAGREVTVELGGEAYGTRDRYARIDGRLYLLDDGTLRPLQHAKTRLVERRVFPYDESGIAQVVVTHGQDARTFVQKNARDRAAAFWADAGTPEARDVEGSTWLGKLFRLRIRSYDEIPDDGALTPVFTFEVVGEDGGRWPVEILSATTPDGPTYYARSTYNRGTVELTRTLTEEAVVELDALFDGVQEEAPVEDEGPTVPEPGEPLPEPADAE